MSNDDLEHKNQNSSTPEDGTNENSSAAGAPDEEVIQDAAREADPWTQNATSNTAADGPQRQTTVTPPNKLFGWRKSRSDADWERETIDKLLFAAIKEQKRSRRWNIFFKGAFLAYLLMLFLYLPDDMGGDGIKRGKHTALIDVQGVIAEDSQASADIIIGGLRAAFKDKDTVGVIMRINSPGGSPVQAGYVNDEIVRLREKYQNIPLYAVIADICASGGYYIAVAADEIYADKASMVGSIGVLMDGFGFTEVMKKIGVERRLLTAGANKGFLDPFSKLKEEDAMHVKTMLANIHQQFIDTVKDGRGGRLKETPDLFSGLVWTGEQSMELGLIDGLGSSSYVAREIIGQEDIVDFTPRPSYFDRFAERLGVAFANTMISVFGLNGGMLR